MVDMALQQSSWERLRLAASRREAGLENTAKKEGVSDRKGHASAIYVAMVAAFLVLLSNIPLLYGYLTQPPGLKFMGIVAGIRDANFYLMLMTQGATWSPFLENYFAPGEPNTIYHGFFWFLLGKIAHAVSGGGLAVFQGARIMMTIVFAPIAFWLSSKFFQETHERIAGLCLISFGAGAGWIMMIPYRISGKLPFVPADVGTPEATSMFTLMSFPHLSLALILIAVCFGLIWVSVSEKRLSLAALAGIGGLILGFIHAVNLVVIYAAVGAFALFSLFFLKDSRPLRSAIVFGSISCWPIAYYLYLSLTMPLLLPQVPVRSPGPITYIVGFLPFLILSLIHILSLIRRKEIPGGDLFLICWIGTNSILLYSYPLLAQEARAILGLNIPLALLSVRAIFGTILPWATPGWNDPATKIRKGRAIAVAALIIAFTFPSSIYNIFERVSRLREYPEYFSLTLDEYEALAFLKETPDDVVVLSGEWIGNYVPRLTQRRTWLGEYDLPSHDHRVERAKQFFARQTPSSERYDFLKENNIGLIYYGRDERELGAFNPGDSRYSELVFRNDSAKIYRISFGNGQTQVLNK